VISCSPFFHFPDLLKQLGTQRTANTLLVGKFEAEWPQICAVKVVYTVHKLQDKKNHTKLKAHSGKN
jgi:hypothetical protein